MTSSIPSQPVQEEDVLFPIMFPGYRSELYDALRKIKGPIYSSIPWAMIAAHERQAQHNHSQTVSRLAERGGLSACEAVAVLQDRDYRRMTDQSAYATLAELVAAWNRRASPSGGLGSLPKTAAPQVQDGEMKALMGRALLRFGDYYRRSMAADDNDESPTLMRICQQRDGLFVAIRSMDQAKLEAAIKDTNIVGKPLPINEQVAVVAGAEQGAPSLGVEPNPPEGGGESQHPPLRDSDLYP